MLGRTTGLNLPAPERADFSADSEAGAGPHWLFAALLGIKEHMTDSKAKLMDLMEGFNAAVVVTQGEDGAMHGRPMVIAGVDEELDMWFMIAAKARCLQEMQAHEQVAVIMQSGEYYVCLHGAAELVDEPQHAQRLWKEPMRAWFSGPDDPKLKVVRVRMREAEYWDTSSSTGLYYLYEEALAFSGQQPPSTEKHGRVVRSA